MKRRKKGFTLIELLTVLAIISMLIALLLPALNMVRNIAKETRQRAQLTTIELALTAFRNDYGDYPPSGQRNETGDTAVRYCGAEKLAEALVGWDLLGFHPESAWMANGEDKDGGDLTYDPLKNRDDDGDNVPDTLKERRGPYLERASANAFTLKQLYGDNISPFDEDRYVLCDLFGVKKVTLTQLGGETVTFKAGTPILYYRANTSSKVFDTGSPRDRIYVFYDNIDLIRLKKLPDRDKDHKLADLGGLYLYDEEYKLVDPKVSASLGAKWPYRADSYILISAGADGEYGTSDDICNF